ncbi:hypothetical protein S7335_393 [Synechococcus sp. PCC 7335]|uniref:hypothetical protein n=1 Tax=Synechococcus sp. (strain ATCC 29403 / PCC 7335) TaxID=91464 RepID=UPI00017EDD6A|nr:hypothetical protein [Synechococcus sp. PCC 7335]EDX83214.1 hypothetical protein S7335_393 [Synechococcus sp. PCC 7335]
MKEQFSHPFAWKPLKWWLTSLLALILALWFSGLSVPVQADPAINANKSPTEQDVFKIGGDLIVTESQTVNDAFAIGGDVTVETGAVIRGDTFAIGGDVQLAEEVVVDGDVFTIGGQIIRADSAVVSGNEFTMLEGFSGVFDRFGVFGTLYLGNVIFWLIAFIGVGLIGLLLLLLLPNHVGAIASTLEAHPFNSLIYGIGGIAALFVLTVLTAGSALGAVLIPLSNLAVLLTSLFGGTAACLWLGRRLQRRHPEVSFRQFWTGLIVLFVVSLVPFIGGALISLVALFGFGATLLARYGKQPKLQSDSPSDRLEPGRLEVDQLEQLPE